MIDKLDTNPDIFIDIDGKPQDDIIHLPIERMYEQSESITRIIYSFEIDEYNFDEPTRLKTALEETIHLCLPSSHHTLANTHVNNEDYGDTLWKLCLFELLKKINE